MSKENHPNFHACKFVTDITISFFQSIRNTKLTKEDVDNMSEKFQKITLEFVGKVEDIVDEQSEKITQ